MKDIHVLSFEGQNIRDVSHLVNAVNYVQQYERAIVVITAFDQTHNKLLAITDTAISGNLDAAHALCDEIYDLYYDFIQQALNSHPNPKNTLILETTDKKLEEYTFRLKKLLGYADKIRAHQDRWVDSILPIGDQMAAYVFSQTALSWGILTQYVEATKLIKTDNEYGQANPNTMSVYQHCGYLKPS